MRFLAERIAVAYVVDEWIMSSGGTEVLNETFLYPNKKRMNAHMQRARKSEPKIRRMAPGSYLRGTNERIIRHAFHAYTMGCNGYDRQDVFVIDIP